MRKLISSLLLMISFVCFSQNKQILYNFNSVPQSLMINPGSDIKYNWFLGIPLLSGVSANIGSSGFSVNDLLAKNGVNFNTKVRNVLNMTSKNDIISLNQQLEIFSAGFKLGDWQSNDYISFGMYQESNFVGYAAKDYATLILDGNANHLGKIFDASDLSFKAELISVFHLGYHKALNEKLILGTRLKIYSSIVNVSSTNNSGYLYTNVGTDPLYDQVIAPNIIVNTSGLLNNTNVLKKTFLGGNLGLGLDLGLTYYPKESLQLTASILDIGFINHTKEVESYSVQGNYNYVGLTPDFEPNTTNDFFSELREAIPVNTLNTKYTMLRPLKFNASIQHSFGDGRSSECNCSGTNDNKYKNAIGAQFFVTSMPKTPIMALTTFYRRQILDSFSMKATYTVDSFSAKNVGLGLSANLGKFNIYILGDNLLEYRDISKANSLSFQLGANIILPNIDTPN